MAITALTDVETLEVSLVPHGANNKKRFPVLKTSEIDAMSDILHAVIDAPSSEDAKFDAVVKSSAVSENPEAAEALKGAMKILNAYSDTLPADQAVSLLSKGLGVEVGKVVDTSAPEGEGAEDEEEEEAEAEPVAAAEEPGELEEAAAEAKAELDEEEDEDEEKVEMTENSIEKSLTKLPPAVRGQVRALWKSNRQHVEKADKLEKLLTVERDERLRKEFVEKASKEFPYVPGKSPEEVGLMLKTLHVVAPEIAADVESIFKSVSATIEKTGLLQEIGSGMDSRGSGASAYAKLDGMAKEAIQKSGGSYAKAFEAAMKTNPELYSQYLDEQGQ